MNQMKQVSNHYKVLVDSTMIGRVRVSRGDVIRRELLGGSALKLVRQGVIEPMVEGRSPLVGRPTML